MKEVSQKWVKLPGKNVATPVIKMKGDILDGYWSKATGESSEMPTKAGAICPIGYTCSKGDRTLCPAGMYCDWTGHTGLVISDASQSALLKKPVKCKPGYYC